MLTDRLLLLERPHRLGDGVQRLYRISKDGAGLSAVNSPMLHSYPFAWEIAVLKNMTEDGSEFDLDYSTPLTDVVAVFGSDEEANDFINEAIARLGS